MTRKALFLFYCALCCSSILAQRTPNTLLWRISGKGLQQPSYLYGTIHLNDQRLFEFGDSLYAAIDQTQGFAIELNPEDLVTYLISYVQKQVDNPVNLEKLLGKEKFRKYAGALSEKLHKPAAELTAKDIITQKNKWVEQSFTEGRMNTFVDAYLFDVARREGKWTGGVEDLADQAGIMDDKIDESDIQQIVMTNGKGERAGLERMIQAYLGSNLSAIDSVEQFADSASRDELLIKRNKKMAWRMDSLSHVRSMVFAVGAAHLPGNEGVIALLRDRGFTLTPVFYSRKLKTTEYHIKEVSLNWTAVDDPNGYYHVQMPGKAGDLQMFGFMLMKMYFNIFNSTMFLTTSVRTPVTEVNKDSMARSIAANTFGDVKPAVKNVTVNGIEGVQLSGKVAASYRVVRMFNVNGVTYVAMSIALKESDEATKDINRFLESFQPVVRQSVSRKFLHYRDETLGFEVDLPAEPKIANGYLANTEDNIRSTLLLSVDPQSGAYIFIGISKAAPAFVFPNDSVLITQAAHNTELKMKQFTEDSIFLHNGYRAINVEGSSASLSVKGHFEASGNRSYSIVTSFDPKRPDSLADIVNASFKIIGTPYRKWVKYASTKGGFETTAPGDFSIRDDSASPASYSRAYIAYDSIGADSYTVEPEYLGNYYWAKTDSILFARLVNNVRNSNKRDLLSERRVTNGNAPATEVIVQPSGSLTVKRLRIVLFGDSVYTLSVVRPLAEINNADINAFFDDFRFTRPIPQVDIHASKAAQLLHDFQSRDSATQARASAAFNVNLFTAEDLPLLHRFIMQAADSSDPAVVASANSVVSAVMQLHDTSSLSFAYTNYSSVTNLTIRRYLPDIIANYKTADNFKRMALLLQRQPLGALPYYSWYNHVTDSTELLASVLPDMLPLLKDSALATSVIKMVWLLADSGKASLNSLAPYHENIMRVAASRYRALRLGLPEASDGHEWTLLKTIAGYNDKPANAFLQRWLSLKSNYYQCDVIGLLLDNHQIISPATLNRFATDRAFRLTLYDVLSDKKQVKLFPAAYATPKLLAESVLADIFEDYYDDDAGIISTFMFYKDVKQGDSTARYAIFKVIRPQVSTQLAAVGPLRLKPTLREVSKAYAVIYDEDYDPKHQEQQLKALIKKFQTDADQ